MKPLYGKDARIPLEKRIVFLGDSITDNGAFISYLDAYFLQYAPENRITLINLGVSSETASGLSEPDHPFPRPCVHDRLEQALQMSKPDWAVVCYGMNDGIYYPFSEERFQAYQEGILRLLGQIRQAGAKAIIMTPPPFDPAMLDEERLLPAGCQAYSYMTPYTNYEEVMKRYADWVLSLDADAADAIINIHDPMLELFRKERLANPTYQSGDGIHPGGSGHWVIAKALLHALFNITHESVPDYVKQPDASRVYSLIWDRHRMLSASWKEHVGHTNPNKAEALPLEQAMREAEVVTSQIRELLV